MKVNFIWLLPVFILSLAHAEISTVACPAANSLQFTSRGSDRYEVAGVSEVISGSMPEFQLLGTSTIGSAQDFQWNKYVRRNPVGQREFICTYAAKNFQGQEVEFSIKAINAEWTQWCTIDDRSGDYCEGNRLSCLLRCEML